MAVEVVERIVANVLSLQARAAQGRRSTATVEGAGQTHLQVEFGDGIVEADQHPSGAIALGRQRRHGPSGSAAPRRRAQPSASRAMAVHPKTTTIGTAHARMAADASDIRLPGGRHGHQPRRDAAARRRVFIWPPGAF